MSDRSTCSKVTDYLYVGGVDAVLPDDVKYGVGLGEDRSHESHWIRYVYIPLEDRGDEEDFTKAIPIVLSVVDDARHNGGIAYIHCTHGQSRSPSAVVAYLVLRDGLDFFDAYWMVSAQRPNAYIHTGYRRAILKTCKTLEEHARD